MQAEDGIRYGHVTGVQTCALPIYVYTVATDNSYAPFEFINEETDELEGFDVDLIKALADEAGIEIEIEQLEFDGIVAGLGSGKFDIGIAGMTITEEREENIDFTQPYYEAGLILAVTDEHDDIESIDDVDDKVIAKIGRASCRERGGRKCEGVV